MLVACMVVTAAMQVIASNGGNAEAYNESITVPEVEEGGKSYVRDYQMTKAKSLVKAGFEVEMMRHREVIVVIVPAHQLFAPGSAKITAKGERRLRTVVSYFVSPGFYRIVVAGYTDNTGNEAYCQRRSTEQATAVADWLRKETADKHEIVEFGMGNASPLLPNNTVANRAVNRRIEILLVPGEGLIEQAM